MSLKEIIDAASTLGALGFALLALYAFLTERIVPRSRLDEQRADKREANQLAKEAIASNERLADATEEVLKRLTALEATSRRRTR